MFIRYTLFQNIFNISIILYFSYFELTNKTIIEFQNYHENFFYF